MRYVPSIDPPFYLPAFEEAFRCVIDDYEITEREIAIFIPCALKKPYSTSPSHRLFRKIIAQELREDRYQIIIFGTCGVLPAELECMFPYAHYQFMLGKCSEQKMREDFLEIETERLCLYLQKTKELYQTRIAYSIGIFREALERACLRSGILFDFLLPTKPLIERVYDIDCPFPEGSLSMQEYLSEFRNALIAVRNSR